MTLSAGDRPGSALAALGAGNAAIDFNRPHVMHGLGATDREILYGDAGYTGETVDAGSLARFADADYYRGKILEFQQYLNALAATADTLQALGGQVSGTALAADIDAWLADLLSNRMALMVAAETVNAAAQSINALGGRMPVLAIPQNLSALPVAAIAAIAAAIAGTAWAISYAVEKMSAARALIARKETLALLPEDARAAALAADQQIAAVQASAMGPLGAIMNVVKWAAIGVAAFFAYKAIREAF